MKKRDYFKEITGQTRKEVFGRTPWRKTVDSLFKQTNSNYPLRSLGSGLDGELEISEEEREANYHIIGQPRQGKSKFIEYNIRKDIQLGNGLCLLDPSDNGDTAKKVLRYCALNGVEKVVYIDPDTLVKFGKIATIQPLKPYPYIDQSVDSVVESVNALFGIAKQTDTNTVRRNLTALLTVLANRGLTLHETKPFRKYQDYKRLPFLGDDEDSEIIKESFTSQTIFRNYFITTVGRLDTFRREPISLMTGADTGIDFVKMISEGWIILVNLHPRHSLGITQARLLGILLISEIVHAVNVLFHSHPEGKIKKIFYLYLDEAARFASPQIKHIIQYMGKTGLRLVIAHHEFFQFREQGQEGVLNAIKNGCRIKMMFNVASYKDRLEMVEDLGYGGDIPPLLASYANQNLPRQEMIIKNNKATPIKIKVPDVPDITEAQVSQEQLDQYIKKLLQQPWYLTKQEIQNQINARTPTIREERKDTKTTQPRAATNSKANRKVGVSDKPDNSNKWKDVS